MSNLRCPFCASEDISPDPIMITMDKKQPVHICIRCEMTFTREMAEKASDLSGEMCGKMCCHDAEGSEWLDGLAKSWTMVSHRNSKDFLWILHELAELHSKKSNDYGTHEDSFANVRASEKFGVPAWIGTMIRGNDKVQRIASFAIKGELKNESVEDSLIDLAAYAILSLVLFRGIKETEKSDCHEKAKPCSCA